ncbi:DUF2850 domain-containing protein [Vibrio hepatarius]|uniref:DUF2850 domain-containing protein n=1 Tax=Vibrio hepatarius TaxID=171383 RepID=UPI001C089490|nr:DUF2850 domain-containing protein [Vibrio hepatarius]
MALKKTDKDTEPGKRSNFTKGTFLKLSGATLLVALAVAFSSILYFSYKDYIHPKNVYGRWIEIGTPEYDTEILTFSKRGVFRNERLITTDFEFDGTLITVTTGSGKSVYQVSGTFESPQLKRLTPSHPNQRFIKAGFEDSVNSGGGAAQKRRAALSEHFSSKK